MKEFELARKALLEHKIIAFPTDYSNRDWREWTGPARSEETVCIEK